MGFQKGNPYGGSNGGGRPKELARRALKDLLTDPALGKDGKSIRQLAVETLRDAVSARDKEGNPLPQAVRAAEKVHERTDGLVPQPQTLGGEVKIIVERV